jgi:hypothetical protein
MVGRVIPQNTLIPSKAPNLLVGPTNYSAQYQEQLNNALRLYFNQIDTLFSSLFAVGGGETIRDGIGGGKYLRFPFGQFLSLQDQTVAANTAAAVTFDTTDLSNGVTVENNSKITVKEGGIYNLQFSFQFVNSDAQLHDASVWFRVNGTDLANSNTFLSVPNSHGGVDGHVVAAWNIALELQANDYVEIYWSTTDVAISIQQIPAQVSPTRPVTPSVIATLTFISGLTS